MHCSLVYVIVPHKIVRFYQHTYSKVDAVICCKRGGLWRKNPLESILIAFYNNGMSFLSIEGFFFNYRPEYISYDVRK